MMNARGQSVTLPTTTIVEAIRRTNITSTVAVKDKTTGQPAGVALFSGPRLRIILTPAEMQAVQDLLTVTEMEALLNTEPVRHTNTNAARRKDN
jgi:hypothetical protein